MQKIITLAALILAIGFLSSCDPDNEKPSGLSKTDAQAKLNALNNDATTDLEDFANADGFKALRSLFDLTELDDPFNGRTSGEKKKVQAFFRKKGNELRTIFIKKTTSNGRISSDEPFDFNSHKGIYEWDFSAASFVKTGTANIIEIHFPTEGSATNNGTLKITAYAETAVYDEYSDYMYYEPIIIQASLDVDDDRVASLDLNIAWDEDGFPNEADITVELVPFSASLDMDLNDALTSTVNASILRDDEVLYATSIIVEYDNPDKSEESIETIQGFIQVRNVELEGTINVEDLDHSSDVNPNDFIDLTLYVDNIKLGEIVFEEDDGEWIPYVLYTDGTKEELEDVLEPILDELENMEDDFDDNG